MYLSTPETVRPFLSPGEWEAYSALIGSRSTAAPSPIPQFSHRIKPSGQPFAAGLHALTKGFLVEIVRGSFPSRQEIQDTLSQLSKRRSRFIHFNSARFAAFASRLSPPLRTVFCLEAVSQFVAARRFLDFHAFTQFLEGITHLQSTFCELLSYSGRNSFHLTVAEVADFMVARVCQRDSRSADGESIGFYRAFVSEVIGFYFDPMLMDHISLIDLITSSQFLEFLELEDGDDPRNAYSFSRMIKWTKAFTARALPSGMLTRKGLRGAKRWELTEAFADRVFERATLFDGYMDLCGFFHFAIKYKNRGMPAAARCFFEIFDVDEDGLVGADDISYFYRSLVKGVETQISLDAIVKDILDQTQAGANGFNCEQFVNCGECRHITEMLADVRKFMSE